MFENMEKIEKNIPLKPWSVGGTTCDESMN
jgi:hypothetical protein